MNLHAVEHHHEILESRAEVYAAEIAGRIPADIPTHQFDRGAELLASRRSSRSNQSRLRRKAA